MQHRGISRRNFLHNGPAKRTTGEGNSLQDRSGAKRNANTIASKHACPRERFRLGSGAVWRTEAYRTTLRPNIRRRSPIRLSFERKFSMACHWVSWPPLGHTSSSERLHLPSERRHNMSQPRTAFLPVLKTNFISQPCTLLGIAKQRSGCEA